MSDRPQNKNLKPFQKGQSGNPSGGRKKLFTADDLALEIEKCMTMSIEDLRKLAGDVKQKGAIAIAASACLKAHEDGDFHKINSMLDRCIGKVKDISEVHQHNHDSEFDKAPRGELIDILRRSNK